MNSNVDISIIIVSYNIKEFLYQCLLSVIKASANISTEIFVVDNNSHDGSVEMVKNEFNQVKLIANNDNLGFARANNQAIAKARGKYILLLNPDMCIQKDALNNMVAWMNNNPQAFIASLKLINESGEIIKHIRKFPTLWDQLIIVLKQGNGKHATRAFPFHGTMKILIERTYTKLKFFKRKIILIK